MYSLRQLQLAFSRPKLFPRELNKWYFSYKYGKDYNKDGIDIFQEDWDNLILLDAFRYDVFEETYTDYGLPGELEHRISRGAATREFLRGNVRDRKLRHTVYVTASPHYYINDDNRGEFHDVIHVWQEEGKEEARAMPPDVMAEYAHRAAEQYPNKRLFLHFVQPHCPFIGETGRERIDEVEWVSHVGMGGTTGENVSRKTIWEAYMENVDLVMPYAKELMEELHGKNVVTSDHGQLLGDKQAPIPLTDYGHPEGIYVETLVKVPWLSNQVGERKEILAEEPLSEDRNEDIAQAAEETLRQLGYLS